MTNGAPPIRAEQLFAQAAKRYPDRVALFYGTRTWTYAEIAAEVRRRAWRLRSAGLPPGATVVAIEPMSDDLLFAWLACCHLGLVFCHLSAQYTAREIVPLAQRAEVRLILTRDGVAHALFPTLPTMPLDLAGDGAAMGVLPTRTAAEEIALLGTTSGTTAQLPKLALISHRALTRAHGLGVGIEGRPGVTATTTQSFKSLVRQLCATVGQGYTFLIASTLTPAKRDAALKG